MNGHAELFEAQFFLAGLPLYHGVIVVIVKVAIRIFGGRAGSIAISFVRIIEMPRISMTVLKTVCFYRVVFHNVDALHIRAARHFRGIGFRIFIVSGGGFGL